MYISMMHDRLMNFTRYRFINLEWLMNVTRNVLIKGDRVSSSFENRSETRGFYGAYLELVKENPLKTAPTRARLM